MTDAATLAKPTNGEATTKAPLTVKDNLPMSAMVKALADSTMVPKEYQGNVSNVMIAIDVAQRIGASPFAVMQSLDIIHGRPSWRASFLIATVNASKRFSPLRFKFEGEPGSPQWGCRAYAQCLETDTECEGTLITLQMAKDEGWSTKGGSKWRTMPEQMLRYRAAAFWQRVYCPELSLGIHTTDEAEDFHQIKHVEVQQGGAQALQQRIMEQTPEPPNGNGGQATTVEPPPVTEPEKPQEREREAHWFTGMKRHSGDAATIRDLADKLVTLGWTQDDLVDELRQATGHGSLMSLPTDDYPRLRDFLSNEVDRASGPDGGTEE